MFLTVSERNSTRLIFHCSSEMFVGFNWICSIKHNWLFTREYFLNDKPSKVITKIIVIFWKWSTNKWPIRIFSKVKVSNDDWSTPDWRTGPDGRGISFDWFGSHWNPTKKKAQIVRWIIQKKKKPFLILVWESMVTNKIHWIFGLETVKKTLVLIAQ